MTNRYFGCADFSKANDGFVEGTRHPHREVSRLRSGFRGRAGLFVTCAACALLAACVSSRSAIVPDGALPLSHDEVTALLQHATVHGYVNGFSAIMKTQADGSIQYHVQPGKEHFAHASDVVHATGNWHVLDTGQFCVSLSWGSSASSNWCRYIFRTGTGYGASKSPTAEQPDNWEISAD